MIPWGCAMDQLGSLHHIFYMFHHNLSPPTPPPDLCQYTSWSSSHLLEFERECRWGGARRRWQMQSRISRVQGEVSGRVHQAWLSYPGWPRRRALPGILADHCKWRPLLESLSDLGRGKYFVFFRANFPSYYHSKILHKMSQKLLKSCYLWYVVLNFQYATLHFWTLCHKS